MYDSHLMGRAHIILQYGYGHPITYCHLSTLKVVDREGKEARLLRLESAGHDPDFLKIASRVARREFTTDSESTRTNYTIRFISNRIAVLISLYATKGQRLPMTFWPRKRNAGSVSVACTLLSR